MTAESVYEFYLAYKSFFQGKYDWKKYRGKFKTKPLIEVAERRYYYRISQKLNDSQIHALFALHFFKKPNAFVTDMATPDAFSRAIAFAARAENGRHLLEADLYNLTKYLDDVDLDAWLYGEIIGNKRAMTPECQQMVIAGEMPLDIACLVLLIPQPALNLHWALWKEKRPDCAFGPLSFLSQLRRVDQLIVMQRPGWRLLSHELAKDFWRQFSNVAPKELIQEAALF